MRQKYSDYLNCWEHYYRDGSYIAVLDNERRILYHPDANRIGEVVKPRPLTDAVKRNANGSLMVTNLAGQAMLAGFAVVPSSGWEIVTQRPTDSTLKPLEGLMYKVLRHEPLALVTLLSIWLFCV